MNSQTFPNEIQKIFEHIQASNLEQERRARRLETKHTSTQPVHVVYGGAHLFSEQTPHKLKALAIKYFEDLASDGPSLAAALGEENWTPQFASLVYQKTSSKLQGTCVEDFRIDFEDGYGEKSSHEEDLHADKAGLSAAKILQTKEYSGRLGIRIKPLSTASMGRSLRTLTQFVESLAKNSGPSPLPHHFTVTLPKVTNVEQVRGLVKALEVLENIYGFRKQCFGVELLIETPEAILSETGQIATHELIAACNGRCMSLHLGIFDLTSSLGIGSAGQASEHETCDFVRMWMLFVAALAPGVQLSDGIINVLPTLPKDSSLSDSQKQRELARARKYNFEQMTRSLRLGFYQGWDLHPSQIVIRHIANHAYVLKEFQSATERMKSFIEKSANATRAGVTFDDRASVLGLVHYADRALNSGILSHDEFTAAGVDLIQLKKLARI